MLNNKLNNTNHMNIYSDDNYLNAPMISGIQIFFIKNVYGEHIYIFSFHDKKNLQQRNHQKKIFFFVPLCIRKMRLELMFQL